MTAEVQHYQRTEIRCEAGSIVQKPKKCGSTLVVIAVVKKRMPVDYRVLPILFNSNSKKNHFGGSDSGQEINVS